MKNIILIFTFTLICTDIFAQISIQGKSDPALDSLFNHRVKSLDEFYARFNGDEFDPGISPEAPESRENNILTLFDKQWLLGTQEKDGDKNSLFSDISTFIKQVCKSKQKLSVDDSLFFAEAKFTVKYLGKDKKIGLILKKENTGNFIYRWSIAGVNGLVENKMLDTTGNNGIRPVDHEMNFVQLRGILNNVSNNLANYRSYDVNIDPLSYFFALVKSKQIVVSQCDAVVYHCFCVKDFYFRIEKYNRNDYNSGWLISDFKKITEKEKLICINKLFDK